MMLLQIGVLMAKPLYIEVLLMIRLPIFLKMGDFLFMILLPKKAKKLDRI